LDTTGDVIFYDNKAKNTGIAIAAARLFNSIPSTNPIISNAPLIHPNFAPCEKFKKTVRQLTDRAKRKPARIVGEYIWPKSCSRKASYPRASFVPINPIGQNVQLMV